MILDVHVMLALGLTPLACVVVAPAGGGGSDPGGDRDVPGGGEGEGEGEGGGHVLPGGEGEGELGDGRFGVVVIDVQDAFVGGAANPDIDGVIDRTGELFSLAHEHALPFFLTFEASTTGDHRLADALQPLLPAQTQQFVKTTYDATGLPAFADAVATSGLSRFVVAGAETDVCVLQTVLGLRQRGHTVVLVQDAVFSSEPNVAPALRRMTQAGVVLADLAQIRAFAERRAPLPDAAPQPIPRATPGDVAIVLDHLDAAAVSASSDPWKQQKLARLRELLLISEWFGVPLYGASPDGAPDLPASLQGLLRTTIRPVSSLAADGYGQIVVAGTDAGLADLVAAHHGVRDVFLMEDALVAGGDAEDLRALLDARYDDGDVPLTYKTLYYELTATVAFEDWPADWIERDAEYYERTLSPEDLPPITP